MQLAWIRIETEKRRTEIHISEAGGTWILSSRGGVHKQMSRFQRIESNSAFGDRGTMIQKVVNNDKGWHIRRRAMGKSIFGVTAVDLQSSLSEITKRGLCTGCSTQDEWIRASACRSGAARREPSKLCLEQHVPHLLT